LGKAKRAQPTGYFTLKRFGLLCLLMACLTTSLAALAVEPELSQIRLPPGFKIETFAQVPNARQMALGKDTLFVGSMRAGKVHAIPLRNGRAGKPRVIAEGLNLPVGVAFRDGDLYISAVNRILRIRNAEHQTSAKSEIETVFDTLPGETHHGWKFIAFGPDGKLYIPVGAPCNICAPNPDRYAMIGRLDLSSDKLEVVARGVRNTVGFDWHPQTRQLWFTDNGRDMLGDDLPPDELNHLDQPGRHFGYPFCHGAGVADPEFGTQRDCARHTPPAQELGAHVAPLGMRFYTGKQFPARYRNAIFVAEHGSWNRSRKIGYRVMAAILDGDRVVAYEPFASGWLRNTGTPQETVSGRPADVLIMPDGSLLVSDDHAGAIYRISYSG
jgi:glucose/arabinose dehydrogenase